jgi:origin recognition complex subunit 4
MSVEVVSSQVLRDVQQYLRSKIFSRGFQPYRRLPNHLNHPKDKLLKILQQVVLYGESKSVLVSGPRNSGKSLIVNRAIADLKADSKTADCFIDIYLNGAVQSKHEIALKEIAIQLSLLTELERFSEADNKLSSADAFSFLLETLKEGTKDSKAIVFVLDEFDQFASKQSQKVLYSLLDQTQYTSIPVAVVGSTCRLDAMDLLEKRIKSRLSQQHINLFDGFSFQEYTDMFKGLLEIDDDFAHTEFAVEWNKHVKVLLEHPEVTNILQNQYDLSQDFGSFQQLLAVPIGKIAVGHQFIEVADLQESAVRMSLDTAKLAINGAVSHICLHTLNM